MADKFITDAGVIEQIRAAMPVANYSKSGLMSTSNYELSSKDLGLSNGNTIRLQRINTNWVCGGFMILTFAEKSESLEIVRYYIEGAYSDNKAASMWIHRSQVYGDKMVELYVKDGYLYARWGDRDFNGRTFFIGQTSDIQYVGNLSDMSSYIKVNV